MGYADRVITLLMYRYAWCTNASASSLPAPLWYITTNERESMRHHVVLKELTWHGGVLEVMYAPCAHLSKSHAGGFLCIHSLKDIILLEHRHKANGQKGSYLDNIMMFYKLDYFVLLKLYTHVLVSWLFRGITWNSRWIVELI